MGDISVTILLAFVSVLLTINLYILKGLRDDLKEGIKKLWEKIDAMVEKYDGTVERVVKMEVEVDSCIRKWDRRHPEE
ncbi:MAG TPA: hypothetical protein VJZ24_02235 [Thermodesulfovibrionales bacterium]|nr:hypothetical protein [Thermodesulfovibrionales bacterium]